MKMRESVHVCALFVCDKQHVLKWSFFFEVLIGTSQSDDQKE